MHTGALVLLVALAACGRAAPARAQPLGESGQSPGAAAIKSLILPGLGQVGNGSWLKGGLFFGAYAGFFGWGVSLNQDVQDATGARNAAQDDAERAVWEQEIARLEQSRNAKIGLAAFVLVLSVAEAYVDAHLRGFDERIDAEVGWIPLGGDPGIGVAVTARLGEKERRRSAR